MSKSVILLGGGYSVKEGIDLGLWDKIKDLEVWSLNFAFKFMPFNPSRQLWIDDSFFKNEIEDLQKLSEIHKVPLYAKTHIIYTSFTDINQVDTFKAPIEEKKNKYFVGQLGLTGTLALSMAIKEKYDIIYLLGYDYGTTSYEDRNTHWYIDKVAEKKIQSSGVANPQVYMERVNVPVSSVQDYQYFTKFPNKIYNVSQISNISYFEKINYNEFFNKLSENK